MAASFISLPIRCILHSGSSISGTVASVDAANGTISLTDARVLYGGSAQAAGERLLGDWTLRRDEVKQLEVLSVDADTTRQAAPRSTSGVAGDRSMSDDTVSAIREGPRTAEDVLARTTPKTSHVDSFTTGSDGYESPVGRTRRESRTKSKSRQRAAGPSSPSSVPQYGQASPQRYSESATEKIKTKTPRSRKVAQQTAHHATAVGLDQDFDFNAGLRSFDKKAVFEQIRSQDQTDPSLRLVSHNKRHGAHGGNSLYAGKLLPSESVLSEQELHAQQSDNADALEELSLRRHRAHVDTSDSEVQRDTEEDEEEGTDEGAVDSVAGPSGTEEGYTSGGGGGGGIVTESESELEQTVYRVAPGGRPGPTDRRATIRPGQEYGLERLARTTSGGRSGAFVTDQGVTVEPITLKQYKEALSIADIETGPTQVQRAELAGQAIASFIVRNLGPHSEVCILCGEAEKAETALRAGVMLLNRGARVTAYVQGGTGLQSELLMGLRVFSSAGGRIVRDLGDIPTSTNLLVDALLPCSTSTTTAALDPALASYLSRATRTPVLSIDSPSGTNHDTGAPLQAGKPVVEPKYVVCRAALRAGTVAALVSSDALVQARQGATAAGAKGSKSDPEVVLVDQGISPLVWKRVGVKWRVETFGQETARRVVAG